MIGGPLELVGTPEVMYARRKMVSHLSRRCLDIGARQVERLMRELGMESLVRGKGVHTTIVERKAEPAPDLLDRDFTAPAPKVNAAGSRVRCVLVPDEAKWRPQGVESGVAFDGGSRWVLVTPLSERFRHGAYRADASHAARPPARVRT